jgi:hypothetical protein
MQELLEYDFVKRELFTKSPPLSLYNLKLCNKVWNEYITLSMIKESIIKEINIRLSLIFGDKYNEFNKILDDTKAVISGSFIIQCILGEYWEDSDIDIYFPTINNNKYNIHSTYYYYDLEKFLYETVKFKMTGSYPAMSRYKYDQSNGKLEIEYVRNYETATNSVQVIQAKIENDYDKMTKFIYNTFDFDICKNVYYINDGKEYINIPKLNDILNKVSEFKIGYRVGSSIERYEKYTKRGFNIINNMTYDEIANKAVETNRKHSNPGNYNGIIFLIHMNEIAMDEYKITSKNFIRFNHHSTIVGSSGDKITKNRDNLTIIRKQEICHDNCLMRFCKSHQKHICYDTKYGQYIFVID